MTQPSNNAINFAETIVKGEPAQAMQFLAQKGYQTPRNKSEAIDVLYDFINRSGEPGLKELAKIHPDRDLILDNASYQNQNGVDGFNNCGGNGYNSCEGCGGKCGGKKPNYSNVDGNSQPNMVNAMGRDQMFYVTVGLLVFGLTAIIISTNK